MNEETNKTLAAITAVHNAASSRGLKKGHGGIGEVACPVCGKGTLEYSVAGYNGRVGAKCTTVGCVSWME